MPEAEISTELVRLIMANVGFVFEGFKDKKYNDRKDRNKYEAPVSRVLAYIIVFLKCEGRNTLLFNRVCKNLEVLDELRDGNTQSLFTIVHCSSFHYC